MQTLTLLCAPSAVHHVTSSFINLSTSSVRDTTTAHLQQAPDLTTVHIAWIDPAFQLDPHTDTLARSSLIPHQLLDMSPPPSNWVHSDSDHFGCLVTSFHHPSYTSNQDYQLFHLRIRAPERDDSDFGHRMAWVNAAH
jgi:hypothetical protein